MGRATVCNDEMSEGENEMREWPKMRGLMKS